MALVLMTTEDGRTIRVSSGAVAMYLRRGATLGGEEPAEPQAVEVVTPTVPAKGASKGEWVAYAVEFGGLTQDEAEGFTRDDLADRFA